MRVLLTVHAFFPRSAFGAEWYTFHLAKRLQALGHEILVFHGEPGITAPEMRVWEGLSCKAVPRLPVEGPEAIDRRNEATEQLFLETCRDFKPDIVHTSHLLYLSTRIPELAKANGLPVVFTVHDHWLQCPNVKGLDYWRNVCPGAPAWRCASCTRARWSSMTWGPVAPQSYAGPKDVLKAAAKEIRFQLTERPRAWRRIQQRTKEVRSVLDTVDRFFATAPFMAENLKRLGVPRERIALCDLAVFPGWEPAARTPREAGKPRFGYMGAVTIEKGLEVLLEAFRGIQHAELVIRGLEMKIVRMHFPNFLDVLEQPNVTVGGYLPAAERGAWLASLDALVIPSICPETGPLVLYEAFASGVPVIGSNVGGIAARVHHDLDGLLFQVREPQALRAALMRAIDDPGLLPRLASGVKQPPRFHEHVDQHILPVYRELTGAN